MYIIYQLINYSIHFIQLNIEINYDNHAENIQRIVNIHIKTSAIS